MYFGASFSARVSLFTPLNQFAVAFVNVYASFAFSHSYHILVNTNQCIISARQGCFAKIKFPECEASKKRKSRT